jgi:ammonium transporter, Amt family
MTQLAPTLFAAFLILLMQAGFGLFATGLCRAKNAGHTMAMHLLVFAIALIGFFIVGFALIGDGSATQMAGHWRFHHATGYLLISDANRPDSLALFLLLAGYAGVTAAIPTGALAERWTLKSFFALAFVIGTAIFPYFGCWIWGLGWLAQLGIKSHLGHGAIDYAGSSVVHLTGGTLALLTTWYIRPRLGKYDENKNPRPILGHNVPMVMLGTLVLLFGWFGFTTGRSFYAGDGRAPLIAVNTLLAGSGGALAATFYMWFLYGRPDPTLTCNGLLAGLVAICAGCAFVAPWAALLIGTVGGALAVWGVLFCERRGLDDPVGATAVHGFAGIWGMLAVGLLADGTFGNNFNDVPGPVRGLLYGGGGSQLFCQFIAVVACLLWTLITGGLTFAILDRMLGSNRVTPEIELAGLDIPEMGAPGYPEFIVHVAPESTGSMPSASIRRMP